MIVVPLTLKEANTFVATYHRHNRAVVGCRFCIGLLHDGEIVGVAVVGRPVARLLDNALTSEITRLCVNDSAPKNSCSKLYRACCRAWQAMGGKKVITYTLQSESGASLRGAGFRQSARVSAGEWNRVDRLRGSQPVYSEDKFRWEVSL